MKMASNALCLSSVNSNESISEHRSSGFLRDLPSSSKFFGILDVSEILLLTWSLGWMSGECEMGVGATCPPSSSISISKSPSPSYHNVLGKRGEKKSEVSLVID